jgi:hypothetical protein
MPKYSGDVPLAKPTGRRRAGAFKLIIWMELYGRTICLNYVLDTEGSDFSTSASTSIRRATNSILA